MKPKNLYILIISTTLLFIANGLYSQDTWKEYKKFASVINPVTNYAMWSDTNKYKLYENCIIALHISDFELDPQKTESGKANSLIVTNSFDFQIPFKGGMGTFSLSILVYKTVENNVSINIQVNGAKLRSANGTNANNTAKAWLNNKISEDVDKFMSQLETIQGKPISTTKTTINIETRVK